MFPLLLALTLSGAAKDAVWLSSAAAADLVSTELALARCPTCREANPLLSTPAIRVAFKVVQVGVVTGACRELRRSGHSRGAAWLRWGVVGLQVGLAVNNLVRMRR